MPVLKAVNRPYQKKEDLKNLVNYAVKGKDGAYNVYGAQGVLIGDAGNMYRQMEGGKEILLQKWQTPGSALYPVIQQ